MRKLLNLVPVLLLASLMLIACSNEPDPTPTPVPTAVPPSPTAIPTPIPDPTLDAEVLTLRYWQAPSYPFPYLSAGTKDRDAGAFTLEPLAVYDPDGNILPVLAADVPTLDNGGVAQDRMSITWNLKKGILWSDGTPMDADDVVFTWRYCVDPETGCTSIDAFEDIASVEAIDELTVRITFNQSSSYPYTAFVGMGLPVISAAQFSDCLGERSTFCDEQAFAPLGTGPYRIVNFEPDMEAIYERNPFYRDQEPYFDRVVMKGGGDALSAAKSVLEVGDADYAWNLQIEPGMLSDLESAGNGTVVSAFSSLVERIVVNQTNPDPDLGDDRSEYLDGENPHPFLAFKPIRQAMSMSIDREVITERLYGFAGVSSCNLIAGPPVYVSNANEGCLEQDIDGAKRLLEENGVVDTDDDGIREHNGLPLRVVYQTSTNDIRQETQSLISDWWREIGIETEITHHDASVFFGGDPIENANATYRRFFADVQMYAGGSGIDPQQELFSRLCHHIQDRGNNWSEGNNARSCDPEYDELYAELVGLNAGAERAELIKRLEDLYVQSYFQIPLVNRGTVSAHLNTLKGVRINGWDSALWNIAEWHR